MDIDEIQCKFPRINNGERRIESAKMDDQYPDEDEEGDKKRGCPAAVAATGGGGRGGAFDLSGGGGIGRLYNWPSSRIVRVSRASGGKDRHSKVLTSKGLRDRRVRLSVNTAIQFYDLQDRLGYDQPSKAVEWLLKAAASSISELPPMSHPFLDTPKQMSDEKRSSTGGSDHLGFDSAEVDMNGGGGGGGGDPNYPKSSACSSTSETGSGLSLSRSESRIKARERAKKRAAEKENEKDKETEPCVVSINPIFQTTSFTELLNSGLNNNNNNSNSSSLNDSVHQHQNITNDSNFTQKSPRQWATTAMDYFTSGLLGPPVSRSAGLANQMVASPLFSVAGDPHFSFVPDHLVPVGGNTNHHHHNNAGYNLDFTISSSPNSSGLAGFNRGTLQSNSSSSSSLLPHLQRFSPIDGSPPSFFFGENHHQFLSGFDGRGLQPCYGDANANHGRQSGHKGKGKNN